jgi:hypothetical protein
VIGESFSLISFHLITMRKKKILDWPPGKSKAGSLMDLPAPPGIS